MFKILNDIVEDKLPVGIQIGLLEDFITNNDELERLETVLNQFNVFAALGIKNQEVRHSNFLAWLLSPGESHGLGDYFLKMFLKHIAVSNKNGLGNISLFEINKWDMSNTIVLKEWNCIDILLVNDDYKFVCVIENKIDSKEHSDQLRRYRETVESHYKSYEKKMFLYLTVNGDRPGSEEIYISLSHEHIGDLIVKLLENKKSQMNGEIVSFINHYKELIKTYIMEKGSVQEICNLIYQRHQKALDILFQYRPDSYMTIKEVLVEIVKEKPIELIYDHASKTSIKFLPVALDFIPKLGEGWTASKRIVLFELQNYEQGVFLVLYVGPGDNQLRRTLYDACTVKNFRGASGKFNTKWNMIYKIELAKPKDLTEKSREEIKYKLKLEIENFFASDYKIILETLTSLKNSLSTPTLSA
jgi:hypothetical protein